jgi:hypothetical protein
LWKQIELVLSGVPMSPHPLDIAIVGLFVKLKRISTIFMDLRHQAIPDVDGISLCDPENK